MDIPLELSLFYFVQSDENLEDICMLLTLGADPNHQSYNGRTLLHLAIESREDNIGIVRELIRQGADVNSCDHLGFTALHDAVRYVRLDVVEELLQFGAFINTKNFLGRTALHYAVKGLSFYRNKRVILKRLLKHEGIDINCIDFKGNTPLMIALKEEFTSAVYTLLNMGANPNIPNKISETPLHVAFDCQLFEEIFILLGFGAGIYALDRNGQTPLQIFLETIDSQMEVSLLQECYFKVIAIKYHITDDLKEMLESFPFVSKLMKRCCIEVDNMRKDFITDKITVHDISFDCFEIPREPRNFENFTLRIYKPVIDRLIQGFYPEYFRCFLNRIPLSNLCMVLDITVDLRKRTKCWNSPKLFSHTDVVNLISSYLSYGDIFCLIAAISNVKIHKSMQNIRERFSPI